MLRTIFAFLLAPFPAALLHSILVAVWPRPGLGIYQHSASMFVFICLFHYALGLVFGVPLYLALRKRRSQRLWAYALVGTLLVLMPMGIFIAWAAAYQPLPISPLAVGYSLLRFGIGAVLTGACFWFVLRPDRRAGAADKARLLGAFD
jgi:hypothetical protein